MRRGAVELFFAVAMNAGAEVELRVRRGFGGIKLNPRRRACLFDAAADDRPQRHRQQERHQLCQPVICDQTEYVLHFFQAEAVHQGGV